MEDILESILGYRTISPSKARKLHHLSNTPPEYWTSEERMLSGKARTRWLHEERKRASRHGSPAVLDRIWPIGPYWPNGGVMAGGERTRRHFREEVGRMRYRDQARAEAEARHFSVHPSHLLNPPSHAISSLLADGDWTLGEPNQILNDRCRARSAAQRHSPWRRVGRADLTFSPQELLRNGRFGAMVGAETEEDRYREAGWDVLEGPLYGPWERRGNLDANYRPRLFEAGNGLGPEGREGRWGRPPFWG